MENFDILVAIKEKFSKFNTIPILTKVKAHSNIEGNERADKLAKEAMNSIADQTIQRDKYPIMEKTWKYLNINNKNITSYPSKTLKKLRQQETSESNNKSLGEKWNTPIYQINTKKTKQLTQNKRGKENPLDASNMNEIKFRIDTITQKLPTNDMLLRYKKISDDTCQICKKYTETNEHIWTCEKTKDALEEILDNTKILLEQRIEKKLINKKTLEILIAMKEDKELLRRKFSRGIIIDKEIELLKNCHTRDNNTNVYQDIMEVIDAWLTAFYKAIWKPRCIDTFNTSKDEEKKRKKIENRITKWKAVKEQRKALKNRESRKRKITQDENATQNNQVNKRKKTTIERDSDTPPRNTNTTQENQGAKWGRKSKRKRLSREEESP